jgi:hypothetical protein
MLFLENIERTSNFKKPYISHAKYIESSYYIREKSDLEVIFLSTA